jgi:hypothetical protein
MNKIATNRFTEWSQLNELTQSLLVIVTAGLGLSGISSGNSAWLATSKWRLEAEVDVLLRVESDHKAWYVDNLLSDTDVALSDEYSGVVNRLGKTEFEDLGL